MKHITVGGTFDRLHAGHQSLLTKAFSVAEFVTVAITADSYKHTKQYASALLPFKKRAAEIRSFLHEHGWKGRFTIISLTDFYGPASTDNTMDSIIITNDTRHHAVLINKARLKNGLKPLAFVRMPFVKSVDKKIIRSSRIRGGEIDRNGQLYRRLFGSKTKSLPQHLRSVLRRPLGFVIPGTQKTLKQTASVAAKKLAEYKDSMVISVGDIVTSSLTSVGYVPHIAVIDYRNHREELPRHANGRRKYTNHAGTIMPTPVRYLYTIIRNASHAPKTIVINGEEDLLAFPAILMAPLQSVVLYGQYNKGIVIVEVTEEIKNKVRQLLMQFS